MNDERNDPNEEASDLDLEDAEQITLIKCEELRYLEKIASNAMFLVAHNMKGMHDGFLEESMRLEHLLEASVLAYNDWIEKEKKNASNTDS